MGIFCEINLFKPSDGVYHPEQVVSGVIKYALDEPMEVVKIVTSLKGIGRIRLRQNGKKKTTFQTTKEFVDIDTIIQDKNIDIPVGSYAINFSYTLPPNIPSSMKFKENTDGHRVKCSIKYYIRLKFEKASYFSFDNHFKREIKVISRVVPKLSREPLLLGEKRKLYKFNPFSQGESVIGITATILNSALPIGGKIEVHYAVANDSHVIVESVKTKLVEAYIFKVKGHRKVTYEKGVPSTKAIGTYINCGETRNMSIEMIPPPHLYSLDNAVIATRHYLIKITAQLPCPHKNVVLNIPVQIGIFDENIEQNRCEHMTEAVSYDDPPPSYWEAMGKINDNEDSSDDEPA